MFRQLIHRSRLLSQAVLDPFVGDGAEVLAWPSSHPEAVLVGEISGPMKMALYLQSAVSAY